MSKVVGEIAIEIGADIGPLVREMGRADKVLDRLDRAADRLGDGLQAVGNRASELGRKMSIVSAAIAATTAGALALVRNAANMGDRIGNAAKAAGMGAEAFQEYAFAIGEAADITEEEFSAAMVILNRRMGEAAEGSSSAAAAFERIGITQDQIASGAVTTEQALAAWVETVEASGSSAEAAALSTDLFGKKGAAMGAMMQGANGQVAGFIARARELGIVVSDDVVKQSGTFNDKMAELGKQFEMVKLAIASTLLPVINDHLLPALQDHVIPGIIKVVHWVGEWISWFGDLDPAIQKVVGVITTAFAVGGPALLAIGAVGTAIGAIFKGPGAPLVALGVAIGAGMVIWEEYGETIKATVGAAVDWVVGKFNELLAVLDKIRAKLAEVAPGISAALGFSDTSATEAGIRAADQSRLQNDMGPAGFYTNRSSPGIGGAAGGQMMGAAIVNGMVIGAMNSIEENREKLKAIFDEVPQIARDTLGIKSPSRVFADIGGYMAQGMAQGITESTELVASATRGMTNAATTAADEGVSGVLSAMGNLFQGSKKIGAGIALANSWLAFTEVLKDPSYAGRPWARFTAAAAALSSGLQAVKNINGAQPGGTGAGAGGAGGAAAAPAPPPGQANLTLVGESFTRGQVETLFQTINDGYRQGYRINLVRQS